MNGTEPVELNDSLRFEPSLATHRRFGLLVLRTDGWMDRLLGRKDRMDSVNFLLRSIVVPR